MTPTSSKFHMAVSGDQMICISPSIMDVTSESDPAANAVSAGSNEADAR